MGKSIVVFTLSVGVDARCEWAFSSTLAASVVRTSGFLVSPCRRKELMVSRCDICASVCPSVDTPSPLISGQLTQFFSPQFFLYFAFYVISGFFSPSPFFSGFTSGCGWSKVRHNATKHSIFSCGSDLQFEYKDWIFVFFRNLRVWNLGIIEFEILFRINREAPVGVFNCFCNNHIPDDAEALTRCWP